MIWIVTEKVLMAYQQAIKNTLIICKFQEKKFATFNFASRFGETDVYIMKQCHRVFVVGFVLPRGSIYKERFSEKIHQLASGGLIDKAFKGSVVIWPHVKMATSQKGHIA